MKKRILTLILSLSLLLSVSAPGTLAVSHDESGIVSTFQSGTLTCTHQEHTHDETCRSDEPSCGLTETEGHTHGDTCKESTLTCADETHPHEEGCYTLSVICDQEEAAAHAHTQGCYALNCEIAEHRHTEDCYTVPETTEATTETTVPETTVPEETTTPTQTTYDSQKSNAVLAVEKQISELMVAYAVYQDKVDTETESDEDLLALYDMFFVTWTAYESLTPEEQQQVENKDFLLQLRDIFGVMGLAADTTVARIGNMHLMPGYYFYYNGSTLTRSATKPANDDNYVYAEENPTGNYILTFKNFVYSGSGQQAGAGGGSNADPGFMCAIQPYQSVTMELIGDSSFTIQNTNTSKYVAALYAWPSIAVTIQSTDGNGSIAFKAQGSTGYGYSVGANLKTLTLKSGTASFTGGTVGTQIAYSAGLAAINYNYNNFNGSKLTVEGGTLIANGLTQTTNNDKSYGINFQTVEITGGSVEATGGSTKGGESVGIQSSTVSISDATVVATGSDTTTGNSAGISVTPSVSGDSLVLNTNKNGGTGTISGDVTLTKDLNIPSNTALTIQDGATLVVPKGVDIPMGADKITNNGTIIFEGMTQAEGEEKYGEIIGSVIYGSSYNLWIGGVQITEYNCNNITADISGANGTATYDPETNTLTLSQFTYSGDGYTNTTEKINAAIYAEGDLNIVLGGSCSVATTEMTNEILTSAGIYIAGNLTISGNDADTNTLTAIACSEKAGYYSAGIMVTEKLTVNEDVSVTSKGYGSRATTEGHGGFGIHAASVEINTAGTVTASSVDGGQRGVGIYASTGSIVITDGTVNASGGNATFYSYGMQSAGDITISGGTVSASAYNQKVSNQSMGIRAGGTVKITGDANVTASGYGSTAITNDMGGYGIHAKSVEISTTGTVTANAVDGGQSSVGIYANGGGITISGSTVTATGGKAEYYSYGIQSIGNDMQITNGSVVTAKAGDVPTSYAILVGSSKVNLIISDSKVVAESVAPNRNNSSGILVYGDIRLTDDKCKLIAKGSKQALKTSGGNIEIPADNYTVYAGDAEPGTQVDIAASYNQKYVHITGGSDHKCFDLTIITNGLDSEYSYIFTISGTPSDSSISFNTMTIVINGNGSKTIKSLPVGEYTVTESSGWSWRFKIENDAAQSVTVDGSTSHTVTFDSTDTVVWKWLDGSAYCTYKKED